jgi:putative transposase
MELMAEILALRQQLAILNRTTKRPSLRFRDRLFWIALASFWQSWRSALLIVKPETVIKWHRQGFLLYLRWKSKARHPGRPRIDAKIRDLIRRLSEENPLWGTPRIQAELHLLGIEVAESTVAKYRIKTPKPSSQTWKTFLSNHTGDIKGGELRRKNRLGATSLTLLNKPYAKSWDDGRILRENVCPALKTDKRYCRN